MLQIEVPDETIPVRSRKNKDNPVMLVTAGVPVVLSLVDYFLTKGKKPSADIAMQLKEYNFWLMMCAFSIHVRKGYAVKWVEFGFELNLAELVPAGAQILTASIQSGKFYAADNLSQPIAYDMQPLKIVDQVDEKQGLVISPGFEFQNVKASLFDASLELEYSHIYPKITGYGKRESGPYWKFEPGDQDAVEAGTKEVRMVVRAAKGIPIHGKLNIRGEGKGFVFPKKIDVIHRPDFYF